MVSFNPKKIPGRWRDGYSLDFHTISSVYVGDDEFGNPQFDTQRSEIGELLFQLKYRSDQTKVQAIVEAAASFFGRWQPGVDVIVPVPPSRSRSVQPVLLLADALSRQVGLPTVTDAVKRTGGAQELKNVYDYNERINLLAGAHTIDASKVRGHRVLLFDDLFRSGATMNAITSALYDQAAVAEVFALTITRTRSHR
jgi:competence protein ComFC